MKFTPLNLTCVGLTFLFTLGKITGNLDWSWWLVFSPLMFLAGVVICSIILILTLVAFGVGKLTIQHKDNHEELKQRIAARRAQQQSGQHREEPPR